MRLICPVCEAKYEVPEDAIPETGRDVQCANCGHSWFQTRTRPETAAPIATPPVAEQPAAAPEAAPETAADLPSDKPAEPGPKATPEGEPDAEPDQAETSSPAEEPGPAPAPYAVDDSVLAILREEAEREAQARRAEAGSLENQPDLGIEAAIPAKKGKKSTASAPAPVAKPTAAKSPAAKPAEPDADDRPAARRDLLPDVEEINSTLRPSETSAGAGADARFDPYEDDQRPGGFRAGFLLVIALAILASALYISAPRLVAFVPALAEPLATYVALVDTLRVDLDALMQMATAAINGQ